jgi:hypothetical protein
MLTTVVLTGCAVVPYQQSYQTYPNQSMVYVAPAPVYMPPQPIYLNPLPLLFLNNGYHHRHGHYR